MSRSARRRSCPPRRPRRRGRLPARGGCRDGGNRGDRRPSGTTSTPKRPPRTESPPGDNAGDFARWRSCATARRRRSKPAAGPGAAPCRSRSRASSAPTSASTVSLISHAASSTETPSGLATSFSTAVRALARSRRFAPPRKNSESSHPSTRLASVTVALLASEPETCRARQGTGGLRPTRSLPSVTAAIDPPPRRASVWKASAGCRRTPPHRDAASSSARPRST